MSEPAQPNRRILVVDDNLSIHDDFRRILLPSRHADDLEAEADALFGTSPGAEASPAVALVTGFELGFAAQGQEACEHVRRADAAGTPFALAFVDMRMPPGWDGLTTIAKLWEIDPRLHVVICTAHSDRTWTEIEEALLHGRDRWTVLKKPFDRIEVVQLAHVMTAKWNTMPATVGPA